MRWLLLLVLGCGSSETFIQQEQYEPLEISISATTAVMDHLCVTDALPTAVQTRVLRLNPPPELRAVFERSSSRYQHHVGLIIELASDGIPVVLVDGLTWGGKPVDAVTHYDRYCAFDACNEGHGVIMMVDRALLGPKSWALENSIDHEIAHIVSGWGHEAGVPLHIAEPGHLLSLGCVNHVCAPWTGEDVSIMCAGAPCTEINL